MTNYYVNNHSKLLSAEGQCAQRLVRRLGFSQGKNNKPSLLISKDFDIYLGNLTAEALSVSAGELFGFYTGSYESKIIQGDSACLGFFLLINRP